MKQRLDILIMERGYAPSRHAAQALILSGRVSVEGRRLDKPGSRIDSDSEVHVEAPDRLFVGRGGLKLEGALEDFGLDVRGLSCLDIGASTGGFTDCLLQRGAAHVTAIDVGKGQLDWKLRNDDRVTVLEGINARYLAAGATGPPADLAVIDVSFISLGLILPRLPALLGPGGAAIALVKPQFEVGRGKVGRGGIIRDPHLRREAILAVARHAEEAGMSVLALARSRVKGAEGNQEYFLHLETGPGGLTSPEIEEHALRLTAEEEAPD